MEGKDLMIKMEVDGMGIAVIEMNRPKALNSLAPQMVRDLVQVLKRVEEDEGVRVVILTGTGRAFCSGMDLLNAEHFFKGGDIKNTDNNVVYHMERCSKPIIGAINGFAITAGFEIALACDILVAAKEAKFIDTHAKFAIYPAWGLSQRLSRLIGPNRAREVSLTSMEVTAEMAEKWGMVNHVVERSEVLNKSKQIAKAIIRNNPDLVLKYKAIINDGFKINFGDALVMEKERAYNYYDGMTREQFQKMEDFIASRGSKSSSKI